MVAIIVDHLNWGPSLWYLLSGGGAMWVSPAEGFFAISGILVGYIYGPRLARSFKNAAKKRSSSMTFVTYATHSMLKIKTVHSLRELLLIPYRRRT